MSGFFMNLVVWIPYPLVTILLSICGTWACILFLPRFGLIDVPHGRHQHERPVPRGGGLAIIVSFFLGVGMMGLMLADTHRMTPDTEASLIGLVKFAIPSLVILCTGLLDDRFELRSIVKLLIQVGIGVYLYLIGCGIHALMGQTLPLYIGMPLTVCWVVGIINAFNLIDGLDGIAAGLASIASFSLAMWGLARHSNPVSVTTLLIFCGACLGFLRYNFSPARIFMGDTGSMFLGLFFAYVSMTESSKAITMTSLLVPLMAVGVPIFDVFLAIWRRFFRRYVKRDTSVSIMEGDHDHLHHRIMKEQGNQRKTAYVIYSMAFLLSTCAMGSVMLEEHLPALVFVVFFIALFSIIRYANIEILDTMTCVANGVRFPHKNFIFTALHPVIDSFLTGVAFVFTIVIFPDVFHEPFSLYYVLIFVCPFTFCLCVSGVYRTFWLRAGIARYYKLMRICMLSGAIGFSIIYLICVYRYQFDMTARRELIGFYLFFFLITCLLIAGERFLIRYFESYGFRCMFIQSKSSDRKTCRTVLVGGGLLCRMYIMNLYCGILKSSDTIPEIIGIIDDAAALQHLNVYGFDVLGTSSDLESIFTQHPFDRIVIALKDISPEIKDRLYEFARKNAIGLEYVHYGKDEILPPPPECKDLDNHA